MIAGFQAMPLWAQIGVGFFAFTFLVMVFGPGVTQRKFRRHLDALTGALGQPPATGRDWPYSVPLTAGQRRFELRYDFRTRSKGSSYRGPTGHLLITSTKLAGTRWPLHQVDISPVDGWMSRLVSAKRVTGDPDFDPRFIVTEDGRPARDGWLDEKTRRAIGQFFDGAPRGGLIWVREGELQYLMQPAWPAADGVAVRALLDRQAALATVLEQTAGGFI